MEFGKKEKEFIGTIATAYFLVLLFVAIFEPQKLPSCLMFNVVTLITGFLVGWLGI